MDLRTVLTPETVELHLKGTTKEEIIDELLEILVKAGKVTDKAAAKECVLDRERKMSTGMKHGLQFRTERRIQYLIWLPVLVFLTRLLTLTAWIRSHAVSLS